MLATLAPEITLADLIGWLRTQNGDFPSSLVRYYDRNGCLTERQEAAARRMHTQAHGAAPAAPANPITAVGFFIKDGIVYKVKRARESGNMYVTKRLADGSWEYVRGGMRLISEDDRITPEQAVEHGLNTGICIFCNAELDDRDGLGKIVGVGPVCARKHLGMTQRQLAQRIGVDPAAAAPAPVAAPEMTTDEKLTVARRALRHERLRDRPVTEDEYVILTEMIAIFGLEGVYADGEVFGEMYAYLD